MLRVALVRGGLSGIVTGIVGMGRALSGGTDPNGSYGPVIIVACISGATAVLVAVIYVIGPQVVKRQAERDPAFRQSHDEATDALVHELVRKEQELQKANRRNAELERRIAQRDRRADPTATDDGDTEGSPGRRRAPRRDDRVE